MYIFRNAIKNITRAKGRTLLIALVAFIIALCSCISLSIHNSAVTQSEEALDNLSITGTITIDREKLMKNSGSSSKSSKKAAFQKVSSLSLSELQKYAKASSVKSFTYTLSTSVNGNSKLSAVENSSANNGGFGGHDKKDDNAGSQGDFTLTGYSEKSAMSDFTDGVCSISKGSLISFDSADYTCMINSELASLNSLSVGDKITVVNPNNSKDKYKLKIVGIYKSTDSSSSTTTAMGGFNGSDSANQIYVNYKTLKSITVKSKAVKSSTKLTGMLQGTYHFASVAKYNKFEAQAKKLGLSDKYTVTSMDLQQYERSSEPLKAMAKFTKIFFIIVLVVGGGILAVINVFNIRERKYEVGVLTAIGMKKKKIMMQFVAETFIVTFLAMVVATGIGAAVSPYIGNKMSSLMSTSTTQSFGGPDQNNAPSDSSKSSDSSSSISSGTDNTQKDDNMGPGGKMIAGMQEGIQELQASTDLSVIAELFGCSILLTIISSMGSVLFVMRYEPLKILSERN